MKRFLALICVIAMLMTSLAFPISAAVDMIASAIPDATAEVKVPTQGLDPSSKTAYMMQTTPTQIPLTMETWVYNNYTTDSWAEGNIFGNKYTDNTTSFSFRLQDKTSYPALDLAGVVEDIRFYNADAPLNEWTHYALTIDIPNKTISCYMNGELNEAKTLSDEEIAAINAVSFTATNCTYAQVGGVFSWSKGVKDYIRGQIGSFAAYSDVRTADEIAADYKDYTSPDKSDLMAAYVMDNSDSAFFKDLSDNHNNISWAGKDIGNTAELALPTDYDYSMFVIGDTQCLSNKSSTTGYAGLYDWLAANVEAKKMEAIIGVGDITNDNIEAQFQLAKDNFAKLDGKILHLPVHGNHDISTSYGGTDPELYKQYVLFDQNENSGSYDGSIHAYYQKFTVGEQKFLFLGLGYSHTSAERAWAAGIIEANPDHNVIISTHGYLSATGVPLTSEGAPQLHDELIEPYSNVVLVLCGHKHNDNVLLYTETREDGTTVQAVLTNPQEFNSMVNRGVATGLYFKDGGKTVCVANHLVGTDSYLGTDSVRSFELDLVERRGEAKVPSAGATFSDNVTYITQNQLTEAPKTYEAWINPSELPSSPSQIFGNYQSTNTNSFSFRLSSGIPSILVSSLYSTGTWSEYTVSFNGAKLTSEDINTWVHVAVTIDTANKKALCYINGALKSTVNLSDTQVTAFDSITFNEDEKTHQTWVGGSYVYSGMAKNPFLGQIGSFAAYGDIRTAEEIAADYLDYTKPDQSDLMMSYIFDKAGKARYKDLSANANHISWKGYDYAAIDEVSVPEEYDYSMIVVGDTQKLTTRADSSALSALYDWIDSKITPMNVQAVIGVGDMTDDSSAEEYAKVQAEFAKINGDVLHFPILGNHDNTDAYGGVVGIYDDYVPFVQNDMNGSYDGTIRAYYQRFTVGTQKFMLLGLGCYANNSEIAWAKGVVDQYPDHNVILSTHAYLDGDGTPLQRDNAPLIREQLVQTSSNIVLVLCGHMRDENVRLFTETREDGTTVQSLFTNPQDFNVTMPYGVATGLYFKDGGKTVNVVNHIVGLDAYLGGDSVRSFELDLVEKRGEAKVPSTGLSTSGLPAYVTQKAPSQAPYTFEAWVNLDNRDNWSGSIFGNYFHWSKGTNGFSIGISGYVPSITFGALTVDGTDPEEGVNRFRFWNAAMEANTWYHVALTVDTVSKQVKCYLNGELKETKTMTDDMVNAYNSVTFDEAQTQYTTVGGLFSWSGIASTPLSAKIGSLAAYTDVRTAEEIKADYLNYRNPDKDNLMLAYIFSEQGKVQYDDLSANGNNLSMHGFTYNEKSDLTIPEDYDYSMFVVGDTQVLTKNEDPASYADLYDWLAANVDGKKTEAIIGVGDITNNNVADQWEEAVASFTKLNGKVNHYPILGNHDISTSYGGTDAALYKQYITLDYVTYEDSYDGSFRAYYHRFTVGGNKFMIVGLGYGHDSNVRAWANEVIKANPDHNVIITTHSYLDGDGSFLQKDGAPDLRAEVVLPNSNVVLVLCGHMHDSNVRLNTERRSDGTTVQAMFTNPQDFNNSMPHGVVTELYFTNGGKTVNVANYIPSLDAYLGEESVRSFELDLIENRPTEVQSTVKAEGFSVRMDGYTGLRGLFSFDEALAERIKLSGYTLVSYGVVASSYDRFVNTYNSDENALFEAARAQGGTEGALKYVPVYNEDGTGLNRYTDYEAKTFCVSLTNISPEYSLFDIYVAGYVVWRDSEGVESYTLTTYRMNDGLKAVNLYEITLGLTKTGIINSENTDDTCFWQILKNGALTTKNFNTENDTTEKKYTLAEGELFTYLDLDWYAFSGASSEDGYSFNPTGVSSTPSGVIWSVLKYTEDEYVLICRNKDKTANTSLSIPQSSIKGGAKYGFYAPYDYRYGDASNIGNATIATYNPALTKADYSKIKTYVVDHGITSSASAAFAGLESVHTIVYPNGMADSTSGSGYKFLNSKMLKNIIWCHEDANGVPVEHMSEFNAGLEKEKQLTSLADLRGYKTMTLTSMFNGCSSIENIVMGTITGSYVQSYVKDATGLRRVWSGTDAMPEDGVLDASKLGIKTMDKSVFACGSNIKTIILPDTVTKITKPSADSGTDYWRTLGQSKSFNYVCSDAIQALIVDYVAHIQVTPKTNTPATANYADGIFVNGTAVTTLIAALQPSE